MALKPIRFICTLSLILALLPVLLPTRTVQAGNGGLPHLNAFVDQVRNGRAAELRGIYVPDILAFRIVPQPEGQDEFVSAWDNVVTQFELADDFGSTGLLAHNYLAGKKFPLIKKNQILYLVNGDGQTTAFIVTDIFRFKALQSSSLAGSFENLGDGNVLTTSELFRKMYSRPKHVILQTCITAENNNSWGRLFIIAEPYSVK